MRLLAFIAFVVLLTGCRKTKLDDEYAIFVGKWKWEYAIERKTLISNGNNSFEKIPASSYPDVYSLKFRTAGKVDFYKGDVEDVGYRVVIESFNDNCTIFSNCSSYIIRLNNKKDHSMSGRVGSDSLAFFGTGYNLPLENRTEGDYQYSYEYYFSRVY